MAKKLFGFLLILHVFSYGLAQKPVTLSNYEQNCASQENSLEKVNCLNHLAELYFVYQLDAQADSALNQAVIIADIIGNKESKINTYFGDYLDAISGTRSKETFQRLIKFISDGLSYATLENNEDLQCKGNLLLSRVYLIQGNNIAAQEKCQTAYTYSLASGNDSLKIAALLQMGKSAFARNESLMAFKWYSKVLDQTADGHHIDLQTQALRDCAELYKSLNNKEQSKEYLQDALKISRAKKDSTGIVYTLIDLCRLTDEKVYLHEAMRIAEKLKSDKLIIAVKRIQFGLYAYIISSVDSTLNFFAKNPDVNYFYKNMGSAAYLFRLGQVYQYGGKPDSAILFYKEAEPQYVNEFDQTPRYNIYASLADCYYKTNNNKEAIVYYEKAYQVALDQDMIAKRLPVTLALSKLFGDLKDFQKANYYLSGYIALKDSLNVKANQKDIALAEINNEKRNIEREANKLQGKKLKVRNLQYMIITIAITMFFFLLLLLGMYPISPFTIRLFGYFVFISIFEFIILLIDNWLHKIAHGSPLWIWLMKVAIIAMIVPVHHFIEHQVVQFLHTRKLHFLREKISRSFRRKKTGTKNLASQENEKRENS
jgi:hypothetical protein